MVGLAKDVSTSERSGFLKKLEAILPAHSQSEIPETLGIDQILDNIQALREAMEEQAAERVSLLA